MKKEKKTRPFALTCLFIKWKATYICNARGSNIHCVHHDGCRSGSYNGSSIMSHRILWPQIPPRKLAFVFNGSLIMEWQMTSNDKMLSLCMKLTVKKNLASGLMIASGLSFAREKDPRQVVPTLENEILILFRRVSSFICNSIAALLELFWRWLEHGTITFFWVAPGKQRMIGYKQATKIADLQVPGNKKK